LGRSYIIHDIITAIYRVRGNWVGEELKVKTSNKNVAAAECTTNSINQPEKVDRIELFVASSKHSLP